MATITAEEERQEGKKPLLFREGLELMLGCPIPSTTFHKRIDRSKQQLLLDDVAKFEDKTFMYAITRTEFVSTLITCRFNCLVLQKTLRGKFGLIYDGTTMSDWPECFTPSDTATAAPSSSSLAPLCSALKKTKLQPQTSNPLPPPHHKLLKNPFFMATSLVLNRRGWLLDTFNLTHELSSNVQWNAEPLKKEVVKEFFSMSNVVSYGLSLKSFSLQQPERRQLEHVDKNSRDANSLQKTPPFQTMKKKRSHCEEQGPEHLLFFTIKDIAAWLHQQQQHSVSVRVDYAFQMLPKPNYYPIAFYPNDQKLVYDVVIYAYRCSPFILPGHDASLRDVNQPFRFFVTAPVTLTTISAIAPLDSMACDQQTQLEQQPQQEPASVPRHEPDPCAKNCQTGVTTYLTGLTSAYHLGVLAKDELHSIAKQLQSCKGYVWAQYDTQNHVRFLSFMTTVDQQDEEQKQHKPHITHLFFSEPSAESAFPSTANPDSTPSACPPGIGERIYNLKKHIVKRNWDKFFSTLKEARNECIAKKREILIDVMSRLKKMASAKGKAFQCYHFLEAYCKKFEIYVFEEEDWIMHFLKIPLAHLSETLASEIPSSKKSSSPKEHLRIIADSENYISALTCKYFTVKNMYPILVGELGAKSDLDYCGSKELLKAAKQLPSNLDAAETSSLADTNILPRILIDHQWTNLKKINELHYSPGRIMCPEYPRTLRVYLVTRACQLLKLLVQVISMWKYLFLETWDIDVETLAYNTFSTLSFKTVWLQFYKEGGPLCQAIEKSKHWTSKHLRHHSRGGFSYSFNSHLSQGDPLFLLGASKPTASDDLPSTARSVMEYDLSQSYGYAASTFALPGGFCMGYSVDDTQQSLTRVDDYKRFDSWEFLATFATIHRLMVNYGYKIRSAFHNYSPLGLFYIDKYPVDLVVVTECKKTILFQFDGIFAHGCPGELKTFTFCQEPHQYAQNQTFRQVRQKTETRNAHIQKWIQQQQADSHQTQQYSYVVITDCHHDNYKKSVLRDYFMRHPELARLIQPYTWLAKTKTIQDVSQLWAPGFKDLDDLTYIIICKGSCETPLSSHTFNQVCGNDPIFYWSTTRKYQTFVKAIDQGHLMITKEFLQHYIKLYNFKVTSVSAIFFYRKCHVLNNVYKTFLQHRHEAENGKNDLCSNLFKRMINYSCGYFGLNPNKSNARPRVSVVSSITQHALNAKNFTVHSSDRFNDKEYFVKATYLKKKGGMSNASVSLPIFVHIIEGGKMRLHQCLTFIQAVTRPNSVRFLYCNIDNMILATAESTLEKCIAQDQHQIYHKFKNTIFNQEGEKGPGKLKLEWTSFRQDDPKPWHFISPRLCTYVLHYNQFDQCDAGHGKMSSFKDLNLRQMYQVATSLYTANALPMHEDERMQITQFKRQNKMANIQKMPVTITI